MAVTGEGEAAKIHHYLDTDKISEETLHDGLYAVATDLLDDNVADILKVSEGRWQIEECFRIMKTDFEARSVYLQNETRIKRISFHAFWHSLYTDTLKRNWAENIPGKPSWKSCVVWTSQAYRSRALCLCTKGIN